MTEFDFEELVKYVSDHVEHDLDRRAYKMIGRREPMPYELSNSIDEYAEEWCNDNGINPDEYFDNYDAEDVFMDDAYDFDA